MRRVLGVDGGGTRTRCVVAREDGRILAEAESGPASVRSVGRARAHESLQAAMSEAWQRAGGGEADAAFLGVAGVASPDERRELQDWVAGVGLCRLERTEVDHDLRIALAGGLAGEAGMVVVAGTGSCCYGEDASGRSTRAGGLGSFVDDPGSGFDLGRRALVAAVRSLDGRGPSTVLDQRIPSMWQVDGARALALRAADADRDSIAGLAVEVTRAADEGDGPAREILQQATEELGLCAGAVARRLGDELRSWTWTGGLTRSPTYLELLRAAVTRHAPDREAVQPRMNPSRGAALLALQSIGVDRDEAILGRLCERKA